LNSKLKLLVVFIIALGAAVFFFYRRPAPPVEAPLAPAVEVPASTDETVVEQISAEEAEAAQFVQNQKLVHSMENVNEVEGDPEAEFMKMAVADLNHPMTRLWAGTFTENATQTDLAFIIGAPDITGARGLSPVSCFATDNVEFYVASGIQFRDNKHGYGILRLDANTYVRMALAYLPEQFVYGKVFKKVGAAWNETKEFSASATLKRLNHCYRSKYKDANNP